MEEQPLPQAWCRVLDNEDWDGVETLWLEALEETPIPADDLVHLCRLLRKAGKGRLAGTLLELLVEALDPEEQPKDRLGVLRELVRMTDKPDSGVKCQLEKALATARSGSPSLDAVLKKVKLPDARRPLEALADAEKWLKHDVGTVVEVHKQGVGRVVELNLKLENIVVDLGAGRPISVPFGAADRFLRVLPRSTFLWRKVQERETLRHLTHTQPGEALVDLLEDSDVALDVPAIKTGFSGLLSEREWSSWWARAKKHPRVVARGTGTRLRYSVTRSVDDAVRAELEQLRAAPPAERIGQARRLAARGPSAAAAAADTLAESAEQLLSSEPAAAWETAVALESLEPGSPRGRGLAVRLLESTPPADLLTGVRERRARSKVLHSIRDRNPDGWAEVWAWWLCREQQQNILDEIARGLDAAQHQDFLEAALEPVFRKPERHAASFVWACERMTDDDAPMPLQRRLNASLLELLPDAFTRKEFSSHRARLKVLLEGGGAVVRALLEAATPDKAQRFLDRLQRISELQPSELRFVSAAVQQVLAQTDRQRVDDVLIASPTAVEAKRAELRRLLDEDIPKTLKGIQNAAAEGDLRENFEYHMLRDRQELQSARAAKLKQELDTVRVLRPGSADTSAVRPGTVVHFETNEASDLEPVTILGPWDADPSRRVFADRSRLARALLDRTVGDEVEVEGVRARICAIEAWEG